LELVEHLIPSEVPERAMPARRRRIRLTKRETLELVRAYCKIRETRVRKRIFETVKVVGGNG
jgi:hypothetical protein